MPPRVCKPDYCEENVIKAIGRKDCNITCCQEDFCNRDGYVSKDGTDDSPTVGGKGHVAQAHWSLGYFSLIVATWVPLLERLL